MIAKRVDPRRTRRRTALLVALVVASVSTGLLAIDAVSRLFMECGSSTELVASSSEDVLIVALPGMTAQPSEQYAPVLDVLLTYGDVLLVDYGGPRADRFCRDKVVAVTTEAVQQADSRNHYQHVVFLGSSIGSSLSVDIIGRLQLAVVPSLVAICAPNGFGDLVSPFNNAGAVQYLPLGWVANRFNIDGTPYQTSFWKDQVAYIASHPAPEATSLDGQLESLTYVACDADEFVRPAAAEAWVSALTGADIMHVASAHVDYRGEPALWNKTLGDLLATLTEKEA